MSLFGKSKDSAFDLLGQAREKILANAPTIPPPGTLARPGRSNERAPTPRFRGGPVASPVIERAIDELLDIDGDPLLVIDDELDVSAITPEEGTCDEEPTKVFGVRPDTAVVFGIGLVLVVAIAYLAGRTAKPAKGESASTKTSVVAPEQAPPIAGSPLQLDTPAEEPAKPAGAPASEAATAAEPTPEATRSAAPGAFELAVCTTSEAKAEKVVAFLNDSPKSPISTLKNLQAYAKKTAGDPQIRIRGFEKKDEEILEKVRSMKDPTGGGNFKTATYLGVTSKR